MIQMARETGQLRCITAFTMNIKITDSQDKV
jgi:hypothetical protein